MYEIWQDIPDYEGKYQASNLGNIRSLNYNGSKQIKNLKFTKHKQGYLMVRLSNNGKSKLQQVHRLIAKTFILNLQNLPEVNHINGIKDDNCVDNLEWCSRLYNQREAERLGLVHSPMRNAGKGHPSNKAIISLDTNRKILKEYYSITYAGKKLNISMKHISHYLMTKRYDPYANCYWKYKEEL